MAISGQNTIIDSLSVKETLCPVQRIACSNPNDTINPINKNFADNTNII